MNTTNKEPILLIDGSAGIHAWLYLVANFGHLITADSEDIKIIKSGLNSQDPEQFWEAVQNIEDEGTILMNELQYTIQQHEGDIWAVHPEGDLFTN